MDQKYIVALELSGSQVKGALACVSRVNGVFIPPTIQAIVAEENCNCVQYGRVQNLINAQKYTSGVIRRLQAEDELQDARITSCYVALAGRSLGSEQTSAELQLATEMEITTDVLKRLFHEASKNVSLNKKVLRVLPRRFYVDNTVMADPVGSLGKRLRGDFTLVTCNPANQRNLDMVIHDKMGLEVAEYVLQPLAVADIVLNEEEKQLGVMLADVGMHTTTISIYKDRCLQYLATLPMGSGHITNDIKIGLNTTQEKAELLKCAQGNAMPDNNRSNDENAVMNRYVSARAFEIAANITANISYAGYRTVDLSAGIVLCGRGARLKNFEAQLAEQSKMPVHMAELPDTINYSFNTSTVRPADFMSLIAVVDKVAHRPFDRIVECITKQQPEVTIPRQPLMPESEHPVYQRPQPQTPLHQTSNPVTVNFTPINLNADDDDNWDKDDEIGIPGQDMYQDETPQQVQPAAPETRAKTETRTKPDTDDAGDTNRPPKRGSRFIAGLRNKMLSILRDDSDLDDDTDLG